ncbi:phosphoglycerate dehydrogenase-like enzyme [Mycobacteroides chelonae]|nr:phosphoglycerate dehydrogenase-like enzyme [Mycobacteroides chelonae]
MNIVPIPATGQIPEGVHGEVLLTLMRGAPNLSDALSRGVKWIHTVGTGVDGFPLDLVGDRLLTCSRGANATPIAEWVMASILTLEKRLPDMWIESPPDRWGGPTLGQVEGKTIAILGFGSIGTAVAKRALAFGANVRAMRRTNTRSPLPGVEMVNDTRDLVNGADHVVIAIPATGMTDGIIDDEFLGSMPQGSHLINVARASLVREEALRMALDTGHLRCASIDVSPVEPLPAGHWFYSHPRVRFSPHVSWNGDNVWQSIEASFIENFNFWTADQQLRNVVDLAHGY